MKKIKKILYFFIVAFCISQAGGWTSASADYSQTYHSTSLTATAVGGSRFYGLQSLGTSLVGTIASGGIWIERNAGSGTLQIELWECPTSTFTTGGCTRKLVRSTITVPAGVTGGSLVTSTFTSTYTLISSKYYFFGFTIDNGSPNTVKVYGSSFDSYANGSALNNASYGTTPTVTGLSDFYFTLEESSPSGSYILNGSPVQNVNTATTTVSYSADYFYNSHPTSPAYPLLYIPTKIQATFTRLDVQEASQYKTCSIVYDTLTTCSGTITLTSGGRYSIGWAMVDNNGNLALISEPYQFGVVSSSDLPNIFTPPQPDFSSKCSAYTYGMNYLCEMVVWFFYPSEDALSRWSSLTLRNSFPFSYIYDIGNLYNELFANTGTMEYAVSVDTGAFGTISFISASQISTVPYASTIKTLLGYMMYFFTAMFLYRIIKNVHS